ncbi:MAG: GNAT family N-acetyltransferase [Treponema sp.]|nr:GNAT family N-acetyltransferase [Treponema sp.]
MNIKIRKVEMSDSEAIRDISTEGLGYSCDLVLVQNKIAGLNNDREAVFVAVIDGKENEAAGSKGAIGSVIGYIHVERYDVLYFESMANILGLSVFKAYHKMGIGKALLFAAEAWAKQNGIKMMRLNSGSNRTDAHGFYQHLGYVSEKEQKRFVKTL